LFSDYAIGDDYAQALAEGLKAFDKPQSLILKGSNLTDRGAVPIINALKMDLLTLDLSYNPKISQSAFLQLFEAIDSQLFK